MAHIQYKENKRGVLVARIQVSGKIPGTGMPKIYVKTIKNDTGLTETKFKKFVNKTAFEFEDEVANIYKDNEKSTRLGILTFPKLAEEWLSTIDANLSHNYFLRASAVVKLFNDYLETVGLYNRPVTDIHVRDVQLFINSFSKGYVRGKHLVKLKKPLPARVNFRELDRLNIINRCSSYSMNNRDMAINIETAKAICSHYNIRLNSYFEDVSEVVKYSPETIKGYRRLLRTIFNEAVRYEWITKNPVCSTKIGATSGNVSLRAVDEKEVYSLKETQDFLKALDALPEEFINKKVPVKIMLLTGLRIGEVCGLKWSDVDFDKKVLHVRRNRLVSPIKGIYEKEPKTKTSKRTVPIPKALMDDLKEYWDWFEMADYDFAHKLDQYYLATTIYREPVYPHSIGNWLTNFQAKNGFKHVSCHGLRHTYCSILLAKNVPLQTVSRYMGHSDSSVTLQVYTHFIPDTQERAVDALDSITDGVGE